MSESIVNFDQLDQRELINLCCDSYLKPEKNPAVVEWFDTHPDILQRTLETILSSIDHQLAKAKQQEKELETRYDHGDITKDVYHSERAERNHWRTRIGTFRRHVEAAMEDELVAAIAMHQRETLADGTIDPSPHDLKLWKWLE